MKLYKTLLKGNRSKHGRCKWTVGRWKKHKGELDMCNAGYHCSPRIVDAIGYVPPEVIAEVEVRGNSIQGDDKQVWEEMRLVRTYRWTKKDSVAMAIYCAELVIDNFEKKYPNDKRPRQAIEVAKKWLKNPTAKNKSAAYSAAEAAARAAYSAAEAADSAAASAAEAAAYSAARAAARAARAAAWAANAAGEARAQTENKIEKFILNQIKGK